MGQKDLPLGSGSEHVKAFERLGWSVARDGKGHTIMEKPGHDAHLSIPNHKEVKRGLLSGLLKDAGISEQEYVAAYKNRLKKFREQQAKNSGKGKG